MVQNELDYVLNGTMQNLYEVESHKDISYDLFQDHENFVRNLVLSCCIVTFVENVLGALVAPFFGEYAIQRFGTSTSSIGATLSAYPFTNMAMSPVCGLFCNRFGRLKMLYFGLGLLCFSIFSFGASNSMGNFFLSRMAQGVGSACTNVALYSLLAIHSGSNLVRNMGWIEMVGGFGDMVGPTIGGFFFHFLPFKKVFPILAAVPALLSLSLPLVLGSQDKGKRKRRRMRMEKNDDVKTIPPPPPDLLKSVDFTVIVVLATTVLVTMANDFSDSTLTHHFHLVVGASTLTSGLLYAIPSIVYPIVAAVTPRIASAWGLKPTIMAGVACLGLSNLLLGPAPFLRFLFSSVDGTVNRGVIFLVLWAALAFWGLGMALSLIPLLPLLQSTKHESDHIGKDMISSFYNTAWSAGEMFGPVVGGSLFEVMPRSTVISCQLGEKCKNGFPWASASFGGLLILWSGLLQVFIPSKKKVANPTLSEDQILQSLPINSLSTPRKPKGMINQALAKVKNVQQSLFSHLVAIIDQSSEQDIWQNQHN